MVVTLPLLRPSSQSRQMPLRSSVAVLTIFTRESSSSTQRTGTSLMRMPLRWARAKSSVSKNHPLSSILGIRSRARLVRIALKPHWASTTP